MKIGIRKTNTDQIQVLLIPIINKFLREIKKLRAEPIPKLFLVLIVYLTLNRLLNSDEVSSTRSLRSSVICTINPNRNLVVADYRVRNATCVCTVRLNLKRY